MEQSLLDKLDRIESCVAKLGHERDTLAQRVDELTKLVGDCRDAAGFGNPDRDGSAGWAALGDPECVPEFIAQRVKELEAIEAAAQEQAYEWQDMKKELAQAQATIEGLREVAVEANKMCELILGCPSDTEIKGDIEGAALMLGHHPMILNALNSSGGGGDE